jgi:branched-chain amino acid transport system permease protein
MPPLNTVVIGVGVLVFLEAMVGIVFGVDYRSFPASFDTSTYAVHGIALFSRQDVFTVVSVLVMMVALAGLINGTPTGLRMRAAAFAPEMARLLGVRVDRMLTLGWALAGLVGALAAMLVIPSGLGLYPQAMDGVFVIGFTAAVVGGLDSAAGAVVGGLITGLVLTYVSGYLGADLTPLGALALLLVVLLARPNGLFGGTRERRV